MKNIFIVVVGLLAFSAATYASHDLIEQPVAKEARPHYNMHDLKHWLTGYPQVTLNVTEEGTATVAGHVESSVDVQAVIGQVKKTEGVRRVVNLMYFD